jgi:hypothetical protein
MKRALTIIGLGLAGTALAVAVSVTAFALVGHPLSEPATGIQVPATISTKSPSNDAAHSQTPGPSEDATHTQTPDAPTLSNSPTPVDDHSGGTPSSGGGSEPGDGSGGGGHGSDD